MRPVDFQLPKELEETKKQLEVARAQIVKNAKTKKEVKIGRKEETKKQLEVARAQIVENVKTKKEVKIGRKEETKKQLEVARAQIVENVKTKKEVKIGRKALEETKKQLEVARAQIVENVKTKKEVKIGRKALEETKKQLEVARAQIVENVKTKKEVKIGRKEETKKQLEVARAQIVENVKTKKEVKIGRKEETKKQLEVARAQIVENAKTKKEVKIERKALIDSARKELGMDCVHHFNFAVSGESGTGKSSFINGIRHVNAQDEGAAEVGVTETTDEITSYPHPKVKHAVVWDLPGAGTSKHPSDTYFYDKKLYAFDCILIVSADRFRKVEFDIAKFALQNKKPFAFVRNKADVSIKDLVERKQMTAGEAETEFRKEVEKSFLDNLTQTGLLAEAENIPLFIVSSKAFIRPSIYNIQDEDPVKCDKSLQKMDEEKVFEFLLDSVKPRMDLA